MPSREVMGVQKFASMIGVTMKTVRADKLSDRRGSESDRLIFTNKKGERFIFFHEQDCCESVWIEDIAGDLSDLEGAPITMAEEVSSKGKDAPKDSNGEEAGYESYTWTFYKFATRKGAVTVRFLGVSNGFYSEGVSFLELSSLE